MKILDNVAEVLLIIAGINIGIIGLTDYDIVGNMFGPGSGLTRTIAVLVGIAAIYHIFRWSAMKKGKR